MTWQKITAAKIIHRGARTSDETKQRVVIKPGPSDEELIAAFERGRLDFRRARHSVPYKDVQKAERWAAGFEYERGMRR
jgi:hypothetical protein